MPLLFFQERLLGLAIFRHNKEIARGVQPFWLSYGVLSTCQCTTLLSKDLDTCWEEIKGYASLQTMSIKPQWDLLDGCVPARSFFTP